MRPRPRLGAVGFHARWSGALAVGARRLGSGCARHEGRLRRWSLLVILPAAFLKHRPPSRAPALSSSTAFGRLELPPAPRPTEPLSWVPGLEQGSAVIANRASG